MDPQVQASFIPKKPLDTGNRSSRGGGGLFFLIALLIFIASIVAAGAEFAYEKLLNTQLASKSDSLTKAQGAYDPSVIQDLVRLDARINQSQKLLDKHVAASAIFSFLSLHTLEKVSFSSFDYSLQTSGAAAISLAGHADSFSTVALQSDEFGASKVLKDVVFSSISVGDKGGVSFTVVATVDPSLIRYESTLGAGATVPASLPSNATSTP